MSLDGQVIFDVRNGGSDNNGGGFRGGSTLAAPSAPSLSTATTGGTIAAGTYFFVVTYLDGNGETSQSAESSITTTGTTSTITVTSPAAQTQGALYSIYAGTTTGGPYWPQNVGSSSILLGTNQTYTSTLVSSGTQAPGTDYSQQTAAQIVFDGVTITGTTSGVSSSLILSGVTPTATHVGNLVQITGGTNFTTGVYQIVGFTPTTWTLDRACASAAASGMTGNMGGAFATPGKVASLNVGSPSVCYIKSDINISLSNSANVSGGKISQGSKYIGWSTNRTLFNLDSSRPTLKAGANSMTLINLGGNSQNQMIRNIIFDANTHTSCTAVVAGSADTVVMNCKTLGAFQIGYQLDGFTEGARCYACQDDGSTGSAFKSTSNPGGYILGCVATNVPNGATAFDCSSVGGQHVSHCIAKSVSSGTGKGFYIRASHAEFIVAYGFSGVAAEGIHFESDGGTFRTQIFNAVGYNCTVNFFAGNGAGGGGNINSTMLLMNSAGGGSGTNFNGSSNNTLFANQIINFQTLTGDPFTNAAGGDFTTNATAGAGALLRALGFPSSFPGLSTTSGPDIGAAQTTLAGGGLLVYSGSDGGAC